jgi:hypothetical protein
MDERAELHLLARSQEPEDVYAAAEALGRGEADPATIQLLIDLATSDLSCRGEALTGYEDEPTRFVHEAAIAAIRQLGEPATDALIDRILRPTSPADDKLLERAASVGRPLFDLARVLVTDGDATRSRAAEPIVAMYAYELELDEALTIYLAICDRERYAARALPQIFREIWPRLGTPEGRMAIAERWTARGLWSWIDDRIDREPLAACTLLALMLAGPPEAEPTIREMLAPMRDQARWIAVEGMLMVDAVRLGEVLAVDEALRQWAVDRALTMLRHSPRELELRMVIACSDEPRVVDALLRSRAFTRNRFHVALRTTRPARLRETLQQRLGSDPALQHALHIAIMAIDGASFTGAGTDED